MSILMIISGKKSKEWKNDIIEKIDKINLDNEEYDIEQEIQEIIDCNNDLKKIHFDLKKLETSLKNDNEEEFIKLLSYIHFEDLLIIKKNYDKSEKYKLFFDITNCKFCKEIKLILLGLFYHNFELNCYFIHEAIQKNEKDEAIDILSEYQQEWAIKIKKTYSEMIGKDLLKYIKDDEDIDEDIKIYLSFLLSNYFFPKIHNDE